MASSAAGPSRAAANAASPASTESSSRRSTLYFDVSEADSDGERSESGGSTSTSSQPQSLPTEPTVDKEPSSYQSVLQTFLIALLSHWGWHVRENRRRRGNSILGLH